MDSPLFSLISNPFGAVNEDMVGGGGGEPVFHHGPEVLGRDDREESPRIGRRVGHVVGGQDVLCIFMPPGCRAFPGCGAMNSRHAHTKVPFGCCGR